MLKKSTTNVVFSLVFLSSNAVGISKTAASMQISPLFKFFSIKLFPDKTTIIHSKTLTLQPLIFGDT